MNTRKMPILATLATAFLLFAADHARAADPCVLDAKNEAKECKATCLEDYQAAKDACLDRDHACVEACRADRYDCRQATGIDDAIAACNATLDGARAQCRADHPAGSPERDHCIDQAQVVAFQCRDSAREQAKPALKACRKTFRLCAVGCAPNQPPNPTGRKQCMIDALAAYTTCRAECKEDFQVAKDACKNRDHACVEQCRDQRAECRSTPLAQRQQAIDQCNATRDAAKDNCKSLYGEGTPERDQCIDNAQVAAFECRDQANEDARPALKQCRDQFQSCVQACPPPA